MQRTKSGLKRKRQNAVRKLRNKVLKSKIHSALLKTKSAIDAKKKDDIVGSLKAYMREIDLAVKKGIIHSNTGARKKSRVVKKIKAVLKEEKQSA
jgi:small subunit ribosomal protein S20